MPSQEVLEKIESTAASMYNEYYLTGEAVMSRDLMNITGRDIVWVNWFSIASIALIIALSFLSPTIPLLLVASIQFAIWVNMGISYMAGESLYFVVYIILGAIQLGATVDYAILLTSKYGEALKEHERLEAMKIAVEKSGRSIMTSALTFIGATIGVALVSNIKMIAQFCGTLGRGAAISALVIIFILPSLLLLFHSPINATTPRWAVHETDEKRRLKAMKVKPQSHL
jgi:predicted RND superfamily exporter protein